METGELAGSHPGSGGRLLGAALDHSSQLLALADPDGRVLDVNRQVLERTGRRLEEVVGKPAWEVMTTVTNPDVLRGAFEQTVRGDSVSYRTPMTRAGRWSVSEVTLTPILGEQGAVTQVLFEARDVTDTAMALHDLQVAQQRASGIVSISADAIISVDESFRITDFNRGAEHIFGYNAAEILGRPLDVLIPERYRQAHRRHMRIFGEGSVDARRMGERREISGLRKGGIEFPADASISKMTVDGRRIYTVVLRDITAQKRSEAIQRFLAQAGNLLSSSLDVTTTYESIARLATDFIADCCVFFDAGRGAGVRRAAMSVKDPAKEPLMERFRGQLVPADSPHPVNRALATGEPLLISDIPATLEEAEHGGDHLFLFRELPVHSAMILPLVARGRTSGAIALYRTTNSPSFTPEDLAQAEELAVGCAIAADNAQLYRAATEAVQARDDVLAVVSHDLGNPLSAIRIGVSLLLRTVPEDRLHGGWEHLAGIKQSVEQMERLIRDLLEVKRIEAGQLSLDAQPVRPAAIIASVVEILAPIAAGKSISVRTSVEPTLPHITADAERVVQALSNLVGNAVKFTPVGGNIEVRAEMEPGEIVFSVIDDGPGIDAEHLDRIFDRFWQARRSRGTSTSLGLGLAIVKGIVLAHGGRVWAESEPGRGTTVRFTLPLGTSGATQAA